MNQIPLLLRPQLGSQPTKKAKVLLVDDDQDLLDLYQEILSQLPSGPEISTSATGARASYRFFESREAAEKPIQPRRLPAVTALLRDNAPNYWEAAWDARRFVEEGARRQLPRDNIGMAINSAASRSQDQLHIHVACIAPKVADFLRRHQAEIHNAWSFLTSALLGHRFAAMKVETDSLAHVEPFKLLNRGPPSGKFSMGSQTLAVIGATFGGGRIGFYLLANESGASPRKIVSAEALLDDKCAN